MKVFLGTLLVLVVQALAGPLETCGDQADCVQFTANKISAEDCDCDCYYNICMKLVYGDLCDKTGSVSHTCEKDSTVCTDNGGFADTTEVGTINENYMTCQKVPANGVAEFLLKDGSAKNGCGGASVTFQSQYTATCETYEHNLAQYKDGSCTGNGNEGKECVWRITAPGCNKVGGCFGDPHIKRWDQKRFDFHGACDLVLMHSDHVSDGVPLDLHIRTTIQAHYSFIESAGLRVGETLFQLDTDKFFVNGIPSSDDDLPMKLDDFTIQSVEMEGVTKIYTVTLNDSSLIKFKVIKTFLSVSVSGHEEDFGESIGLLGNYYTGEALGRNGRLVEDFTEYGMEWQVGDEEPKIFQDSREPQLPLAKCVMPTEEALIRRLRSVEDTELTALAERECASKEEYDSCMEDVLATGDIALAGAW